jgi:hypothetical protein
MSNSSAARTNLSSLDVRISNRKLGEGAFRICHEGTYIGGNRNSQEAACKRFKPKWRSMEAEYFASDFFIADTAIRYAECWNNFCDHDEIILITKGHIITSNSGIQYLAEPLIRNFKKFTSNSGWILNESCWTIEAMEAFSHYTYHASNGELIVCDLQGRYRDNRRFRNGKSRFELTDVAICSGSRSYGPTDLSEKGIESFFANHECNQFCNINEHWRRPSYPQRWFPKSSATSMFSSSVSYKLQSTDRTQFRLGGMGNIIEEEDSDSDYY